MNPTLIIALVVLLVLAVRNVERAMLLLLGAILSFIIGGVMFAFWQDPQGVFYRGSVVAQTRQVTIVAGLLFAIAYYLGGWSDYPLRHAEPLFLFGLFGSVVWFLNLQFWAKGLRTPLIALDLIAALVIIIWLSRRP